MGSYIHLTVGNIQIDWGKNDSFFDYGILFERSDLGTSPYFYVDDDDTNNENINDYNLVAEYKESVNKPLKEVIERLLLLGSKASDTKEIYDTFCEANGIDSASFTTKQFDDIFTNLDVGLLNDESSRSQSFKEFLQRVIAEKIGLKKDEDDFSLYFTELNYPPFSILQLINKCPASETLTVSWQYADILEGGWVTKELILNSLGAKPQFLIVTEGSSDANIIRRALSVLRPNIANFFRFVDMDKGYPFSGTGKLVNFTAGLISIGIENNVIILFDNDAEGVASYNRALKLAVPSNMKILKLPNLPIFENFRTIGPSGEQLADINGSAAAIECYLDTGNDATVRWTSYNTELAIYQGELEDKRNTMMRFLNAFGRIENYDYSKIQSVLDHIIRECTEISSV